MATPIGQIQTTCIDHMDKQLDLYCETCDTLVCLKCLSTSHKGHHLCELSDITPQRKEYIKDFIDRTEKNDLVQLRDTITSSDTLLKDNTSHFESLSHKLKTQTDQLKQNLDILTSSTLSLYNKMKDDNSKLIQTYKQDLEMYDKQLKHQIQKCKAALQRGSQIEIYDAGCEIYSQIRLPVKPVLDTASFTPNKHPQHHLELALGDFSTSGQVQASTDQDGSVRTSVVRELCSTLRQSEPKGKMTMTDYKLLPETKVLEEWRSPYSLYSICPTTDGQAWTKSIDTLMLLDRKGTIQKLVKHNVSIKDISLSPKTHTLWACDAENNIVELISGRLTHRFITKETPECICVTANNHVIVGMAKHISKYTTQGQMVLTTMAAWTGKPFVCSPFRISECPVTHNVAVADWNNEVDGGNGKSLVVVMDTDFKEQCVYGGEIPSTYKQASHRGTSQFLPHGVVYDSVGNLIIGDLNNNRVILLSGGGEFLRAIHTDAYCPWAVGVDREDVLWAVFGGTNVKVLQYSSV